MSGRRSSRAEGRLGGTTGTRAASGPAARVRSAGGAAGQDRDRVLELGAPDAEVDRLRLRGLELGQGGDDVRAGDDAGVVLVLGDLERAAVVLDGAGRAGAAARRASGAGNSRPRARLAPTAGPRRGRRRSPARSRRRSRRCAGCGPRRRGPSSPALEAEAVGDDDRAAAGRRADAPLGRQCCRLVDRLPCRPAAAPPRSSTGRREKAGARLARRRRAPARKAASACFRVWFEIVDLPLQPVEHRVAVDRPPGAAVDRVLRLGRAVQPASSLNAPGVGAGGRS